MKKPILILGLIVALAFASYAQQDTTLQKAPEPEQQVKKEKEKKPLRDKIYFGGTIGLSFGSYTRIAIYPMIGYKFTPKLSGGIELGYEYITDNRYNTEYNTSNYGGSLFARYRIIPAIYVHVEYATYNYELYYSDGTSDREWVPFLFLGAGLSQRLGGNTYLYAQVKFDVLQHSNSPYEDWAPFWNVGLSVGF